MTEENFVQIDEFYKLITPNAEADEPMKDQQMAASRHIVKFLEASPEAVVGTTCILEFVLWDLLIECVHGNNSEVNLNGNKTTTLM